MARIRSVHPGLFTDEAYMSLSMAGKAALPGIWTECDDQGVFEWKPLVLKARIFPADNVDMKDILDELACTFIVQQFSHEGRAYGVVRNFRKWQRPEKPKNRYPLPDELHSYAGLSPTDPQPVADQSPTGSRKSPQRKEEGGRRKDEDIALASDIARAENADAPEGKVEPPPPTPAEPDPPHWAEVQNLLATPTRLDEWETDFLHAIKWAKTLTKPQREKLTGITSRLGHDGAMGKPDAAKSPPTRVRVKLGSEQWEAWRRHLVAKGKRPPNPLPLKDENGNFLFDGWYFDAEWPPAEEAA